MNILILLALAFLWYMAQVWPLAKTLLPLQVDNLYGEMNSQNVAPQRISVLDLWLGHEDDVFFGTVHYARQSPVLGKVTFRLNEDDRAEFQLWLDRANLPEFEKWFGPKVPMMVMARRVSLNVWVVTGLACAQGALDAQRLSRQRIWAFIFFMGISLLILMGWVYFWNEYRQYFRYRPWFFNRR